MKRYLLSITFLLSFFLILAIPPAGYYSIALDKSKADLKTSLFLIISKNTVQRSYDDLWRDMRKTDVRSDGKVWDMYSNCNFTFGTDQKNNKISEQSECQTYNREHSVPRHWFGGEVYPMNSDLFHLYPTDTYVNAGRDNYPYGETSSPSQTFNNGSKLGRCTFSGYAGIVFEPIDEYKGDFARTYFYFVTRYQDKMSGFNSSNFAKNTYPSLSSWTISMLTKWHRNDPVSKKELDRNDVVFSIQKNRNPYIDHPELVEYIWGNMQNSNWNTESPVIITQVYGGGGNNGATYKSDFVELYNNTSSDLDISGWSLQYASSTKTSFSSANTFTFPSNTIIKGQRHFAVKCADGQSGVPWNFTFDASTTSLQLSGSAGKVVLMKTSTPVTLSDPPLISDLLDHPDFVDYLPFGTASVPVFGSSIANTTSAQSVLRKETFGKYQVSMDVGKDFITTTPNPRNSTKGTTSVTAIKSSSIKAVVNNNGVCVVGATDGVNVQVYSSVGRLLRSTKLSNGIIPFDNCDKGVYFIKVEQHVLKVAW